VHVHDADRYCGMRLSCTHNFTSYAIVQGLVEMQWSQKLRPGVIIGTGKTGRYSRVLIYVFLIGEYLKLINIVNKILMR